MLILGMNFLLSPVWVYFIAKENEEKKNKEANGSGRENLQDAGKETVDALKKNFQEIADQFRSIGKK